MTKQQHQPKDKEKDKKKWVLCPLCNSRATLTNGYLYCKRCGNEIDNLN